MTTTRAKKNDKICYNITSYFDTCYAIYPLLDLRSWPFGCSARRRVSPPTPPPPRQPRSRRAGGVGRGRDHAADDARRFPTVPCRHRAVMQRRCAAARPPHPSSTHKPSVDQRCQGRGQNLEILSPRTPCGGPRPAMRMPAVTLSARVKWDVRIMKDGDCWPLIVIEVVNKGSGRSFLHS